LLSKAALTAKRKADYAKRVEAARAAWHPPLLIGRPAAPEGAKPPKGAKAPRPEKPPLVLVYEVEEPVTTQEPWRIPLLRAPAPETVMVRRECTFTVPEDNDPARDAANLLAARASVVWAKEGVFCTLLCTYREQIKLPFGGTVEGPSITVAVKRTWYATEAKASEAAWKARTEGVRLHTWNEGDAIGPGQRVDIDRDEAGKPIVIPGKGGGRLTHWQHRRVLVANVTSHTISPVLKRDDVMSTKRPEAREPWTHKVKQATRICLGKTR